MSISHRINTEIESLDRVIDERYEAFLNTLNEKQWSAFVYENKVPKSKAHVTKYLEYIKAIDDWVAMTKRSRLRLVS